MELGDYIEEFVADWSLAGRSTTTANIYSRYLEQLDEETDGQVTLASVKRWLASAYSAETARARARAVRAFGRWSVEVEDGPAWLWWKQVPLANTPATPQETVDEKTYNRAIRLMTKPRDRLVIELLWCTGCRVSELARLKTEDINFETKSAVIRTSKTGKPRMVPLSAAAIKLIRRHAGDEWLLDMTIRCARPSPVGWPHRSPAEPERRGGPPPGIRTQTMD